MRQLGERRCKFVCGKICGASHREAEDQLGKKHAASRTELQQDSGVSSPMCERTHVREIGKMDE